MNFYHIKHLLKTSLDMSTICIFIVLFDKETESNFLLSFFPIIISTTSFMTVTILHQSDELSSALLSDRKQHKKTYTATLFFIANVVITVFCSQLILICIKKFNSFVSTIWIICLQMALQFVCLH